MIVVGDNNSGGTRDAITFQHDEVEISHLWLPHTESVSEQPHAEISEVSASFKAHCQTGSHFNFGGFH